MLIIISRLGMRLHKEGDLSQKLIADLNVAFAGDNKRDQGGTPSAWRNMK